MSTDRPVLILDADAPAGLACVQSLGRARIEVHAAVRHAGSCTERSRWCRRVHVQPPPEQVEAALAWLIELDGRFSFDLIVPTSESTLRWLARLPESHPLRAKGILPSDAALEVALDKERTREIARDLGLSVPGSTLLRRGETPPPPEGPFPKVLKPVRSKVMVGSRLTTLSVEIVRDIGERDEILAAWLPFTGVQKQEWVPGRGFGVEVLYDRGRMAWHFVHQRPHEWPLTGSASTWRRACGPETKLAEQTKRLLDRLVWHGVAMVEGVAMTKARRISSRSTHASGARCRSRSLPVSTFRRGCSPLQGRRPYRRRHAGVPARWRATLARTSSGRELRGGGRAMSKPGDCCRRNNVQAVGTMALALVEFRNKRFVRRRIAQTVGVFKSTIGRFLEASGVSLLRDLNSAIVPLHGAAGCRSTRDLLVSSRDRAL